MVKITDKIIIPLQISEQMQKAIKSTADFKAELEKNINEETTKIIEKVLLGAISLSASDIHFEPREEDIRLRIRLDGMLHDVMFFPPETYRLLLSRIKLLAGLKLNVHNKPQDGSFSIAIQTKTNKEQEIEIRTSALPADFGESVVMRILNPESLKSMEELGLRQDLLESFKKEIKKPNGMIIVTGPTGSGKTTTLYAFLKYIQNPEIKIITIEDPIEYRLDGTSQTEVNPSQGYDFASGLRSIVRQDPDVILVGEIRDLETAKISLQAALTGHLVFSTLHTNDAAGAIPRLISLGSDPINIGPAINMVIAQRLVRRVCKKCAGIREATPEESEEIKRVMKNIPNSIVQEPIKMAVIKGCKECSFTGYKGRQGIFEAFLINDQLESLIVKKPAVPEIKKIIAENGMITMFQDGMIKVLEQITTIEEVKRVTSEN
ncbi:GspE/PulE family protein [Patescibacteria group bacterium]|nr:GspE/PulE family protein [Patescibacteria group bacterium]MBU4162037.1 GspE/PulE family protein [Patescibacteria group bacterium]